jgi:hypothetical protein
MASKTIKLSNIQPGEYLSWFATTQAAFQIRLKLFDSKKTYFEATRKNTNIDPPMAQGSAQYAGSDLQLFIDIPEASSANLDTFLNTFTLLTPEGTVVGHSFSCCGEDQTDKDYNDFYLNVMAWKSKG